MPAHHWVRKFEITQNDIEYLTGLLLEQEQPMTTEALAQILIENRLRQEVADLKERFKDARFYNPADSYDIGQRIIFPLFDNASARVIEARAGINPEYESFVVIKVEFESENGGGSRVREFASGLAAPHSLSRSPESDIESEFFASELTAEDILDEAGEAIIRRLEASLREAGTLVYMAGLWFPEELLLEVNVGHINLAEAILDINGGGPLPTETILQEIGGLGQSTPELQAFSLNYVLKDDDRFDEVGPKGSILWYLRRLEPPEVQRVPAMLQYKPVDYDRSLLSPEMLEMEQEIDDELSDLAKPGREGTVILIYPHRRMGTLPLNAAMRRIFPMGQKTERVYITLVDGQDGEEYPGWVLNRAGYVYDLNPFYRKHQLPIGASLTAMQTESPGRFVVNFDAYRPRSEWVRIVIPRNNQIGFEDGKRAIGAAYDDLMILGVDELEQVDSLFETTQRQGKTLASVITNVLSALAPLSPQRTVHAKTIYSAVNVVRRCPPGLVFATLVANVDFQNVGGHYWKLSSQ